MGDNHSKDLAADGTCEAELRRLCSDACVALDEALVLFLSSDDVRGPHKARVALRRLTTCLDAFAPLLRSKPLSMLRGKAKTLFRKLGKVRDSDVYAADRADQPGQPTRLRQNMRLRETIRTRLRNDKAARFSQHLMSALSPGGLLFRRRPRAIALRHAPVRAFAAGLLQSLWSASLSWGPSVAAMSPSKRHQFRKTVKSLRYSIEFFSGHLSDWNMGVFRSDLRDLQDALGVLNDFDMALEIEGKNSPKSLPPREAMALAAAETLWSGLSKADLPWAGQDTRRP